MHRAAMDGSRCRLLEESVRYHARGGGIHGLAKRLRGRKLTRAWVSSSKEGIVPKSRSIVNTSSTRTEQFEGSSLASTRNERFNDDADAGTVNLGQICQV